MPAEVEKMFYFGEVPWHGLGTRVERAQTAAEAIQIAGLDWGVDLQGLRTETGIVVPHRKAVVRADNRKVLSVVSNDYKPLDNRMAFSFFDGVVREGEAIYHTAGSLEGGKKIWILAKLPGEIVVLGKDIVDKYLLLSNGHDGRMAIHAGFTGVRVVCRNTLDMAISNIDGVTIRHRGNFQQQFQDAREAIGIAHKWFSQAEEQWAVLASTPFTDEKLSAALNGLFPVPKVPKDKARIEMWETARKHVLEIRAKIKEYAEVAPGVTIPGVKGSAWGAWNAIIYWADHGEYHGSDEARLKSLWFGPRGELKREAFDMIVELAKN